MDQMIRLSLAVFFGVVWAFCSIFGAFDAAFIAGCVGGVFALWDIHEEMMQDRKGGQR